MQTNRKCSLRQVALPLENQAGINNTDDALPASALGGGISKLSRPIAIGGVEFQTSEICPKNFVIFDQIEDKSQIMFLPTTAHNLSYSRLDFHGNNVDQGIRSPYNEDSDDIDALLSLDEYQGESEDEEVSTARTEGYNGSSSPDSCSNYSSKARKVEYPSSSHKSSVGGSESKRNKTKKMVKVLRGMIPGGEQMSTVAVLDEAVRYLKSMKMESQKLGFGNLKTLP